MNYNFSYPLRLRLMNPAVVNLREEPYKGMLEAAVEEYNESSKKGFNPKRIRDLRILGGSEFSLILDSNGELDSPGRALRFLSQSMVRKGVFERAVLYGRLLLTLPSIPDFPESNAASGCELHPEDISDEDFLKGLIHFMLNKSAGSSSEYKKKRATIDIMKAIAADAEIIEIDQLVQQKEKK